jgi:hypothetical protein
VADAAKAADDVIQPALERDDATRPMSGARHAELRAIVRKRVVNPPVTSVEIWKADGTIVFADRRSALGEQTSSMQPTLHDAAIEGSRKIVEGDTFRALVGTGVPGGDAVVVEIDRPYDTITAQADERWHPWVGRGVEAAVLFLVLYAAAVGPSIVERRTRAAVVDKLPEPVQTPNAAPATVEDAHVAVRRRRSDRPRRRTCRPASASISRPGARPRTRSFARNQALDASELDRQRLQDRLNQAESELADARRRLSELGATAGR